MDMTVQFMQKMLFTEESAQKTPARKTQEDSSFEAMLKRKAGKPESQKTTDSSAVAHQEQSHGTECQEPGEEQEVVAIGLVQQPMLLEPVILMDEVQAPVALMPEISAAGTVEAPEQPMMQADGQVLPQMAAAAQEPVMAQSAPETVDVQLVEIVETAQRPAVVEQTAAVQDSVTAAPAAERTHTQPTLTVVQDDRESDETPAELPLFTELKAVPVKVAEPEEPVDLTAPNAAKTLADRLTAELEAAQKSTQDMSVLMLQVEPAELGPVKVLFSKDSSGMLHVMLEASNPRAAALLGRNLGDLQSLLSRDQESRVEVTVQQSETPWLTPDDHNGAQQQRQNENREEHRQQNGKDSAEDFLQRLRLGLTEISAAV